MNSIAIALIVKATVLIGAAFVFDLLLRRRTSAATRHLVLTFTLGGVLLLPILSLAVPSFDIPIYVPARAPAVATTGAAANHPAPEVMKAIASDVTKVESPTEPAIEAPATTTFGAAEVFLGLGQASGTKMAVVLYGMGVVLLGLRLGLDRRTLRRLVRQSTEVQDRAWRELLRECEVSMGVARPVRLLRTLEHNMPMTFGILTPTILIPAIADTWSKDRRRAVLLHELAHIDRRDCFTQLLTALTCAAYWMHPGVWWVARRLRVEREIACDDRVLCVGTVARDYAAHLLELAYSLGGYRSPALVVSMARPRQLEGRMLAVLDQARNRVTPTLSARAMGLIVAAAFVLPLAAAEAVVVSDTKAFPVLRDATRDVLRDAEATPALVESSALSTAADGQPPTPARPARPAPPAPPPPAKRGDNRPDIQLPGTFEVRPSDDDPNRVHVRLSDRPNSMRGFDIDLAQLALPSPSLMTGFGGAAKFNIVRDAGTLVFEGVFKSGLGAGTFDFTPNPTFPSEMVKRGFASPTATEQYQLARGNIGFAYLDELQAQKYDRPSLDDLVRASDHGVHLDYLKDMGGAGYHFGQIGALVRARDHGVTKAYIMGLAAEGYKNLSAEELARARDHGVTPQYVGTLRAFGHKGLSLKEVTDARDHGVHADFIRDMAALGLDRLSLVELVRARDHGVTPEYVKAMRDAGYGASSLDELVRARDHGVSAGFVRGMAELGPERPSLDEMVRAKDHGVDPSFIKAWRDLGYKMPLDDLVRARDRGVRTDYVKELSALGYERLTIDELIRLHDHGVSASFAREQNSGAGSRLTVEELVRRRDGRRD